MRQVIGIFTGFWVGKSSLVFLGEKPENRNFDEIRKNCGGECKYLHFVKKFDISQTM